MGYIEPSRLSQELRPDARNVPGEVIEPVSTTATMTSTSSSLVAGEIRSLWFASSFPEHAHSLLVSSLSFSSFSPSSSDYVFTVPHLTCTCSPWFRVRACCVGSRTAACFLSTGGLCIIIFRMDVVLPPTSLQIDLSVSVLCKSASAVQQDAERSPLPPGSISSVKTLSLPPYKIRLPVVIKSNR
jgi:hypothetical protein